MGVDSPVRRGTKRGGRVEEREASEPEAARVADLCDWCKKPGDERPAFYSVASIRQDVYAHVCQTKARHYACGYSACVACVPRTRTDLIAQFHGVFQRQAEIASSQSRIRFIPPAQETNDPDDP